ncbi:hypothetical protein OJF2_69820 [Aquisphaera giovannonii]|uniref:Uncharacterized protein n=1 Tax=Aquisphaera giovannonii TaxID=406548 RepID=A0A5B9WEK1_9BACT|nr:hypothetical protein [Aquisphaera giovannonii]QEH38381.1 hypothetical protein OJF2_69820 [Aquisphaera giovannonii]
MESSGFTQFLIGIPWFAWIAIVAIICGSISGIIAQCQRHFERMEMIRQGMDPDNRGAARLEKWQDVEV